MAEQSGGGLFRRRKKAQDAVVAPPSSVRVLREPEDVAKAIARAIQFEQNGTARYRARLDRYGETLAAHEPQVVSLSSHEPGEAETA